MEIKFATFAIGVLLIGSCSNSLLVNNRLPLVLTTWPYEDAVNAGWKTICAIDKTSVDAVEATGNTCELEQCRHTVGFGGSPDENGETTLDAMIMDGNTHNVGGVGGLRRVKSAISVARYVLDNTNHTLLVGDQATQFAVAMGFKEENLTTNYSQSLWEAWKQGNCQPNFRLHETLLESAIIFKIAWPMTIIVCNLDGAINRGHKQTDLIIMEFAKAFDKNVTPDPRTSCGPYSPKPRHNTRRHTNINDDINADNHDTIGIIAIDDHGNIAAGASTNGLTYKVPGRVGDSPIAGAGAYADSSIGAAACTGNGDIMMRFLPSYQAVTLMGTGMSPVQAAATAIRTIAKKYPTFVGAVVAANKAGDFGAACHLWTNYKVTFRNPTVPTATVYNVTCNQV